jgi:hypothetical protein
VFSLLIRKAVKRNPSSPESEDDAVMLGTHDNALDFPTSLGTYLGDPNADGDTGDRNDTSTAFAASERNVQR